MTDSQTLVALAWAMADLHNILPNTECSIFTAGDTFRCADFYAKHDGGLICRLVLAHETVRLWVDPTRIRPGRWCLVVGCLFLTLRPHNTNSKEPSNED